MTVRKWLQRATVEDGTTPGQSRINWAGLRRARKRIRLLEQENKVLRQAEAHLPWANLPGKSFTGS